MRLRLGWPRPSWGRIVLATLAAVGAVVMLFTLTHDGRTAAKTGLFMANLIPDSPVRPLNMVTVEPERLPVRFGPPEEGWEADLYLPDGDGPHPAIIVALGAAPAPLDDFRVRRLGDGLARMGTATLIPVSPTLVDRRVTPREIDFLVEAFEALAARPEVDGSRIGYVGVCVGSSLSFLAAADERIADDVAFVSWFGGYYRTDALIASTIGETILEDGEVTPWRPNSLTRSVVRKQLLGLISDPDERAAAELAADAPGAPDEGAFSDEALAVLRLLRSESTAEAERRILDLSQAAQDELWRLSPASATSEFRAALYLMSDRGDRLVPYPETRKLAAVLEGRIERDALFDVFSHVDLDRLANPAVAVPNLGRLYAHVHAIFQEILSPSA